MLYQKSVIPALILLLSASITSTAWGDNSSHQQAIDRLFELTGMQNQIEDSVSNVLALQLTQNPHLREHENTVREFLERHIGWQSLKSALTDMYMKEFNETELNTMNEFYASATGKKVIQRLPVLVQMRNKLASARLQKNIGELEYELSHQQTGKATP